MMKRSRIIFLPLLGLFLAAACGGDDHEDLSSPAAGGSGGGTAGCTVDGDCPSHAPVCDQLVRECVECLFDTQCGLGKRCASHRCVEVVTCSTSLDCVASSPTTICDPLTSTCVECVDATDCPMTADCIANVCKPYQVCSTSLDCDMGLVCDPAKGRCVVCASELDCQEGEVCVGNACVVRTPCVSDNQCTPLGQLCDKTLGYCVDCLNHDECPDAYHCELGFCVLNACQAGANSCQGNDVVTCKPDGSGWGPAQACGEGTTCKIGQGCVAWSCTPGGSCQGDQLITCSDDGSKVLSSVDCSSQGLRCILGECSDLACAPNQQYCEGAEVRLCNPEGADSTLVKTCGSNQVCDSATASCVSLLCTPGAPVCHGSIATTCNASGTGYLAGGMDCALQNKTCSDGSCLGCPSGGVAPDSVRLAEVFLGGFDYIVLINRGSCPAQIDTLSLRIVALDSSLTIEIDMPSRLLGPGEKAYVVDKGGEKPGDIVSVNNIYLTPNTGESVVLCQGPCSSGVVLDYFAHASGGQPPLPPGNITFTPAPVTGITASTQDSHSYTRVQYTGSTPSFKASDWKVEAASRPHVNSVACPTTPPDMGTSCLLNESVVCKYGAVSCSCMPVMMMWVCM